MPKHVYIRSTADGPQYFPTLTPSLEVQPGQVVGVPESVGVPAGFEAAKKADGKDVVTLDHPQPERPADDPWAGEPDTSADFPLDTLTDSDSTPVTPTV